MFILTFTEKDAEGVEQVRRLKATGIRKINAMLAVDRLVADGSVESFHYPTSNVQVRSLSEVWACE